MHSYPQPAQALVDEMTRAALDAPARAVALQGAPGCNSHRAALDYDPDCLPLPCFSFEDALDAVTSGKAARAIIPIENSQHGRVADIHFLLPDSGLSIVGEYFLPISYAVMGLADENGKTGPFAAAYSHPQALGQTRLYLRERGIVPMSYADTAGAAAFVKEQGDAQACAVAPRIAADLYGLKIVDEDVADAEDNTTRFVVLSAEPLDPASLEGATVMTTFVFQVKNQPAALYKALGGFATNGVNMTKLESYQQGASFAATTFYTDVEGAPGDPAFDRCMAELGFHCEYVRMLGSYRQARTRG
ncbi:MAG TPA: prephenate dehydratase [Novosphingobium sp.]|nr:prephenate dehydratase [Novosphingobium sp.]